MTALLGELRQLIGHEGPITVERYMALCLGHPTYGYYRNRDPFGLAGDFTTAPEISQMFGELIGLWAAEIWTTMGMPSPVRLVELGPGRGTLMSDCLRAACAVPAFASAIDVHLVETSLRLRDVQQERLSGTSAPVRWHENFEEVPPGPAIIIANEFLDALPVRQHVRTEHGWCERLVGLHDDNQLVFGLAAEPDPGLVLRAPLGAVLERSEAGAHLASEIADRVCAEGGAALLVDYGYTEPGLGDTLQAVRAHAYADPLAEPGEADLTTHVNFGALLRVARARGASVHGPVDQGAFLSALGIEARAARLKGRASPAQAEAIDRALERLTGSRADQMGTLFKAVALAQPTFASLPGFAKLPSRVAAPLLASAEQI